MKQLLLSLFIFLGFSQAALADDCFSTRRIHSWRAYDDRTMVVEAGRYDYELSLGFCSELRWAHRIAFRSFFGDRVCRGDRVLVLDNYSNYIRQECYIYNVEKL